MHCNLGAIRYRSYLHMLYTVCVSMCVQMLLAAIQPEH